MERGIPIDIKCPKCRGQDVNLSEFFLVYDVYEVRGGKLEDRVTGDNPQATNQLSGECINCKHRWNLRSNPIQRAALDNP